jgi:N-acetyl-anhydromuramyl-L-alanine amidase AmpD
MSFWLPRGHHLSLHIERRPLHDAGRFTGGGWKLVWHTTQGSGAEGAFSTVRAERSAPHFIIDHSGRVIQTVALNRAACALEHNSGPETNLAHAIQVECVGHEAQSGRWSNGYYTHLADLFVLINHRLNLRIPNVSRHSFHGPRLGGREFVRAQGHLGHLHVPGNNHTDPGKEFRVHHLIGEIRVRGIVFLLKNIFK